MINLNFGKRSALTAGFCATLFATALFTESASAQIQPKPPASLCVDDAGGCVPATPVAGGAIKWYPGHYLVPWLGDSPAKRLARIDSISNEATIRGMQIRYRWAELEPAQGRYDFSAIDADLAVIRGHGKRLIISVIDRKFGSTNPDGVIPQYVVDAGWTYIPSNGKRIGTRVWEQPLTDRLIALYQALGAKYDRDANVAGFAFEGETALGSGLPASYSATNLVTQAVRLIEGVRAAAPRTLFFPFPNYINGDSGQKAMSQLMQTIFDKKAVCSGGPDTLPSKPTSSDLVINGTHGGRDYREDAAIMYSIEVPELYGKNGFYTPAQLYDYAVNQQKANFIFWPSNDHYGSPDQQWLTGILPMLRSVNGRAMTACPKSFAGSCSTN